MIERFGHLPFFHFLKNPALQNFIFLLVIQSSNILITLISMPILIQVLGVDQFGLISLALSVVFLANYFVDFGFSINSPREVALLQDQKPELSRIFSTLLIGKVLLAGCASGLIILLIFLFGFFEEYQTILVFSLILLFSEATNMAWFFQGMEKLKLVSLANIVARAMFLLAIILYIQHPDQAKWVNFTMGSATFVMNLAVILYAVRSFDLTWIIPKARALFDLMKGNLSLLLSNLAIFVSTKGSIIILSFFSTAEMLGMFSLAERPVMVIRLIPSLVIQAIFPRASRLYLHEPDKFTSYVKKSYVYCIVFGLIISLLTFLLAPYIVFLLSKRNLPEAVFFLKLMAFVPFLASLNVVNMVVFLVKNQKSILMNVSFALCVFMISVTAISIHLVGPMGAAIGILATEAFVFVLGIYINYKKNKPVFDGLLRGAFRSGYLG
ncbi:oligosaccharide flippase family protein [Lunatibacter salilacus]|uniref:oligosaccharide flippase family protein n=1 Tax=Lunatibacter salilacus TaxID=2483804 RepID=UPI00131E275E|nr:oligosaccharide flippase family protein [Lunatibacter salilacus]